MSNKVIIYDKVPADHIEKWLRGLLTYLKDKGFDVHCRYDKFNYEKDIKDCYAVMCWNGQQTIHEPIKDACKKYNVPFWYIECGPIIQSKYYYLDNKGINASSSIMDDDFSDITEQDMINLDTFRKEYLQDRKYSGKNEYILCPLQLENDTNIISHSPYKHMQDFINYVENKYPKDRVLFKVHPVMSHVSYKTKYPLIYRGSFLDLAQDAKLVIGINSTCLLESLLIGTPTIALGEGLVKKHSDNIEKLLAKLIKVQIPINKTDLDQWLNKILDKINNE